MKGLVDALRRGGRGLEYACLKARGSVFFSIVTALRQGVAAEENL